MNQTTNQSSPTLTLAPDAQTEGPPTCDVQLWSSEDTRNQPWSPHDLLTKPWSPHDLFTQPWSPHHLLTQPWSPHHQMMHPCSPHLSALNTRQLAPQLSSAPPWYQAASLEPCGGAQEPGEPRHRTEEPGEPRDRTQEPGEPRDRTQEPGEPRHRTHEPGEASPRGTIHPGGGGGGTRTQTPEEPKVQRSIKAEGTRMPVVCPPRRQAIVDPEPRRQALVDSEPAVCQSSSTGETRASRVSFFLKVKLSKAETKLVVGLRSVLEVQCGDISKSERLVPFYMCRSCRETIQLKHICGHVTSLQHQLRYMWERYPKMMGGIWNLEDSSEKEKMEDFEFTVNWIAEHEQLYKMDAEVILLDKKSYHGVRVSSFSEGIHILESSRPPEADQSTDNEETENVVETEPIAEQMTGRPHPKVKTEPIAEQMTGRPHPGVKTEPIPEQTTGRPHPEVNTEPIAEQISDRPQPERVASMNTHNSTITVTIKQEVKQRDHTHRCFSGPPDMRTSEKRVLDHVSSSEDTETTAKRRRLSTCPDGRKLELVLNSLKILASSNFNLESPPPSPDSAPWTRGHDTVPAGSTEPWTRGHDTVPAGSTEPWTRGHDTVPAGSTEPWTRGHDTVPAGSEEPWTRGHKTVPKPADDNREVYANRRSVSQQVDVIDRDRPATAAAGPAVCEENILPVTASPRRLDCNQNVLDEAEPGTANPNTPTNPLAVGAVGPTGPTAQRQRFAETVDDRGSVDRPSVAAVDPSVSLRPDATTAGCFGTPLYLYSQLTQNPHFTHGFPPGTAAQDPHFTHGFPPGTAAQNPYFFSGPAGVVSQVPGLRHQAVFSQYFTYSDDDDDGGGGGGGGDSTGASDPVPQWWGAGQDGTSDAPTPLDPKPFHVKDPQIDTFTSPTDPRLKS